MGSITEFLRGGGSINGNSKGMGAGEPSGTVWNSESKEEWLNILEFPKPAKGLD